VTPFLGVFERDRRAGCGFVVALLPDRERVLGASQAQDFIVILTAMLGDILIRTDGGVIFLIIKAGNMVVVRRDLWL
jgi:hypothetical protein